MDHGSDKVEADNQSQKKEQSKPKNVAFDNKSDHSMKDESAAATNTSKRQNAKKGKKQGANK